MPLVLAAISSAVSGPASPASSRSGRFWNSDQNACGSRILMFMANWTAESSPGLNLASQATRAPSSIAARCFP